MKTILFTITIFLISFVGIAQKKANNFTLDANGFTEFVVLEFEDTSAEEIFQGLKKWYKFNIRNAKLYDYGEIENEFISFTMVDPLAINVGKRLRNQVYNIHYDVSIRIKDEKARVDLHIIEMPHAINKNAPNLQLQNGWVTLYKNSGKPKASKTQTTMIKQINKSANQLVSDFDAAVKGLADYKYKDW